jgi:hypothetical protein
MTSFAWICEKIHLKVGSFEYQLPPVNISMVKYISKQDGSVEVVLASMHRYNLPAAGLTQRTNQEIKSFGNMTELLS